jgi:hypothetical protein
VGASKDVVSWSPRFVAAKSFFAVSGAVVGLLTIFLDVGAGLFIAPSLVSLGFAQSVSQVLQPVSAFEEIHQPSAS